MTGAFFLELTNDLEDDILKPGTCGVVSNASIDDSYAQAGYFTMFIGGSLYLLSLLPLIFGDMKEESDAV